MQSTGLHIVLTSAFACILAVALSGCGGEEEASSSRPAPSTPTAKLDVTGAWARPAPSGGRSALYFTIANGTTTPDTLLRAAVDSVGRVEIHETSEADDGTMQMRRVGPVPVPPKSRVTLEPRGTHVMLIDLQRRLVTGDTLTVDLTFARKGLLRIEPSIRMTPPTP